ncbi:DNA-binding domain-containing protein [Aestuariivirga sp.]|uniref:HvfC/BufC N-terminal domain-containing protein n=1 Tax=Aestuariivirga sp. TaxID=2650926 RepID=UPI003BA96C2A
MPSLSETQSAFRTAVTADGQQAVLGLLRASGDAAERLEIYRRHYRESFRRHLRGRYPTLEWILGTDRLVALADAALMRSPPRAPSLAEYGEVLVDVVADARESLPAYAADVARLDWRLGCLSVAVSREPMAIAALAAVPPQHLAQITLGLQPGLAFLASGWPVDELLHLRHQSHQPEQLVFEPRQTLLQLRGARGRFSVERLSPGGFTFRARLAASEALGAAASAAVEAEPGFDLSAALGRLFSDGLVINLTQETLHA